MAASKEAQVRQAATARGLTLERAGKGYRLVAENGTVVADDWFGVDGVPLPQLAEWLAGG